MPVITVTAVDTTANTLTATAHLLTTGDRFRLRNVGGALPASTPALPPATAPADVFAIVVDANTLKVSDTNSHALANTGIFDLTGSGSGTTTVEYGLPYCIPTVVATPNTLARSADANGVWNALVALYCLLTGLAQSVWSGITLAANQHVTVSGTGQYKHGDIVRTMTPHGGSSTTNNTWAPVAASSGTMFSVAAGDLQVSIPMLAGDQIKEVTFRFFGNGTADMTTTVLVSRPSGSGGLLPIGSVTNNNQGGGELTVAVGVTDTVISSTDSVYIIFSANAAGIAVEHISITLDHP